MSEQDVCEWYVAPFAEDDGRCLAPAVAIVTTRRRADGHERGSARCAEHLHETNPQWLIASERRIGLWVGIAVFTEGIFAEIRMQPEGVAHTFVCGMVAGANHYAGSLSAYVLPYEAPAMARDEKPEEVTAALAAYGKAVEA